MRHHSESLARAIGIAIACAVAVILAVSFIGYAGETIVQNFTAQRGAP